MKRHVSAQLIGGILLLGNGILLAGWPMHVAIWDPLTLGHTAGTIPVLLCSMLCGVALLGIGRRSAAWRTASFIAIWTTVAIAGLTLVETAFSIDVGIDLPALHRWYPDTNPYPGRMSPNTAMAFLLTTAALHLHIDGEDEDVLYHALPAAVITMGVIGLAAYTSLFDLAYDWYAVPHMAATSALTMMLLGIALLVDQGADKRRLAQAQGLAPLAIENRRGYAFFGIAITILAGTVVVSYGSIRALGALRDWVEHTAQVKVEFETLNADVAEGNGAWRTYVATGDSRALQEALTTRTKALGHLDRLAILTGDNPRQQERLRQIRQLMEANVAVLEHGAAVHGRPEEVPELIADPQQFESLAAMFRAEESRLLAQRRQNSDKGIRTTTWVILGGNALAFALLFYAGWLLKRQNNMRDRLLGALQESYSFLDSLIEHIPSLITVKDAKDLRVVRVNRAGERLLGVARSDTLGKTNHDLFPSDAADVYTATDRAALEGSEALRVSEQSIVTRNAGTRIVHTTKIPISGGDGTPKYLLSISEDVTERKLAEQEIATLNQRLTARAGELEASNKELESFTYSVSHDLRAPLRAINGYALMLEEDYRDKLGDEARRYIQQIRSYSRHMGDLIDDLLRLSRFGRQALQVVDIDMNCLVREVLADEARDERWSRNADVRIGELPGTRADPQLIRLVWTNLIANAFKYSSKKERPLIEIGGRRRDSDMVYSVTDNGAGFDMAYYEKLFGVFQRLHRNDEFPGTGVGLALAHRIIMRHGGRLWAEAAVDKGATFYFALPYASVVSTTEAT